MYKKITHSIIEEHFDHPMANKIKSTLERRVSRPTNFVFNEDSFRNNINSYTNGYSTKLASLINGVTGTDDDLITAFESLFMGIDDLGTTFKHFYQSELAERMNVSFRGMALLFTIMINSVKAGRDYASFENRVNSIANDIGVNMSLYNSRWDLNAIRNVMTNFISSGIAKINARHSKNSAAEQQAEAAMRSSLAEFSNIVQTGIMGQFPDRFTMEGGMTL